MDTQTENLSATGTGLENIGNRILRDAIINYGKQGGLGKPKITEYNQQTGKFLDTMGGRVTKETMNTIEQ